METTPGYPVYRDNGLGLVGLLGLNGLNGGCSRGIGDGTDLNTLPILNTLADLRKDTQEVSTEVHKLGNEMVGELHKQTINFNEQLFNQSLALGKEFCDLTADVKEVACDAKVAVKESIIEGMKNTQSIKDQVSGYQVINSENFCEVKSLIREDGEKTRSLINANRIEDLRDALAAERRHTDRREQDIHITNTNINTQQQIQAQLQAQTSSFANSLNLLGDQIARQTNSVINLGTMLGNAQTATSANTKVNS